MSCPFVFQMKISSMQWAFVVHYLFSFLVPMFICLCNYAQMSPCKESSPYTHLYLSMVESSPCSKNLMFILLQAHLMYSTHQQVFVHNNHYVETRHISLISKCHHLLKIDPNHKPQSALERWWNLLNWCIRHLQKLHIYVKI